MPPFDRYQKLCGPHHVGEHHKLNADMIIEETWWNDIDAQVAYLYDYYHDYDKAALDDSAPYDDDDKIPIEVKFMANSMQTFAKDNVTFHIQLRPSQECNVPYYENAYAKVYGSKFPVGMYIDIKDSVGKYNRWLIVGTANYNDVQFPTYEVLRCDYVFRYVYSGTKYECACVLRSQNSYNSGLWTDYKIQSPEDQIKMIVPLNRITEHLYYNQRAIIDANVLTEPRAWLISKINRLTNCGVINLTFAQDRFDQNHDYIELDDDGNVKAMWADYYQNGVEPKKYLSENQNNRYHSTITYSGLKPELKVGGSYKTFTVGFFDESDVPTDIHEGQWVFKFADETDASAYIKTLPVDGEQNKLKVKFVGDDSYIGSVIFICYESDVDTSRLEVGLNSL